MRIIHRSDLREGRWRNGMGVSWDIASEPADAAVEDFGWRFAIARIDDDVPFSRYPEVDRIFTLIEGSGLDLDLEGRGTLAVGKPFVPHAYPCDITTFCRLRNGACRALNLFVKRGVWTARAKVQSGASNISHAGPILLFALDGAITVDGKELATGDAAVTAGEASISIAASSYYVAKLAPR